MFDKIEFACNLGVNSLENIECFLEYSGQDKEKVSEILKDKYSYYYLEQIERYPEIGNLFHDVYQGSLGFSVCSEVMKAITNCQVLLKDSLIECSIL